MGQKQHSASLGASACDGRHHCRAQADPVADPRPRPGHAPARAHDPTQANFRPEVAVLVNLGAHNAGPGPAKPAFPSGDPVLGARHCEAGPDAAGGGACEDGAEYPDDASRPRPAFPGPPQFPGLRVSSCPTSRSSASATSAA